MNQPDPTRPTPRNVSPWVAAVLLAASVAGLATGIGGVRGLAHLLCYLLATVPGWPIGWALFGRRHAAGWAAGAIFGYALSCLAIWTSIRYGSHGAAALALAWLVVTGATYGLLGVRRDRPLVSLPRWQRSDTTALCLVLLLVPILCSGPFLNVGKTDPDGTRAYRAYFTMDFFWHTALTAEVSKFTSPPRNPYLAQESLRYYWTYFLLPAAVVGNAPPRWNVEVQPTLLVNALCTDVLLLAMMYLLAWTIVPRAGPVSAAVALTVLAASAEGLYAITDLLRRGQPLAALRDLNVDAVTAWTFRGLRVDSMPRSFWWVPQHGSACAMALVALIIAAAEGAGTRLAVIAAAGCALGLSVTLSPFIGAAFSLVYGASVLLAGARPLRRFPSVVARHALSAVPVALALAWCARTGVLEGTSGALKVGWGGLARHSPLIVLVLSVGPVLLPALVGILPAWRLPRRGAPAVAGLLVGLGLLYFVWIPLDEAYVGFRAGQVLLMTMPALVALGLFGAAPDRRRTAVGAVALSALFLVGVPTTVIDWYNAQDTTNRAMGPGFHWTQVVTPQQQQAFRWIRRSTLPTATVQMDAATRGRDYWTFIPTFGERAMAAGLGYSLLQRPVFAERAAMARRMYETLDGSEACAIAHRLGVDYVYVDQTERRTFPPAALAKFDGYRQCFRREFANDEVSIFAVARQAP